MATRLFVGNLPYSTTSDDLAQVFRQAGQLVSVQVISDKMTGRSKGFGFVEVSDPEQAVDAIRLFNGCDFDGRLLIVNEARPMEPRSPRSAPGSRPDSFGETAGETAADAAASSSASESEDLQSTLIATLDCPTRILEISSQVTAELLRRLALHPAELRSGNISSRLFEEIIAEIWHGFGFDVELTKQTRDGGYDIIAIRRRFVLERFLIECKKPMTDRKIGVRPVRELYAVKVNAKATKAILATTGRFTRDAITLIDDHKWELEGHDFDSICAWLRLYRDGGLEGADRASRF